MWLAVAALVADAFVFLSAPDGALDARLFYSPDTVVQLMHALHESGRTAYRLAEFVDLGFIVLYTILIVNWLRFFANRKVRPRLGSPWLGVVPGVFDAVETLSVLALLHQYPTMPMPMIWAAVFATPLKWLAVVGMILVILGGEVAWWKKRRRR